ncbi:MAG: UDP-N-acetylglucosamine 1-carboxyvinyltransferase [Clostridiales bacterium]|nr:UDP-N-acetylglucosamine 1-carboxyvinyltransferase [Clostridiales bacterium]
MDNRKFIIEETPFVKGDVLISGSKNAALPIMAAALLTSEKCVLKNIPPLRDIIIMENILNILNVKTDFLTNNCVINIKGENLSPTLDHSELMGKIRASFLTAGSLLTRFGKAKLSLPGGCSIGTRPIDLHLKGFSKLGAEVSKEFGIVELKAKKLKGAEIYLDFPSVGATENIIMAAVKADGITTISNAAQEPEITDLCNFLIKMGAEIEGQGTDTVKITGVKELHGTEYTVIPDRIEAGTFMIIGAASGEVTVKGVRPDHLRPVVNKLSEMGASVTEKSDEITVKSTGRIKNADIKTLPYPGFPTDMQPQFMSLMTTGSGTGIINETIFENRFLHAGELNRMGADIKTEGNGAVIRGVERLTGTKIKATDLRAGAALIISAISAMGITEISNIEHIERGYYNIDKKLKNLGVKIKKC